MAAGAHCLPIIIGQNWGNVLVRYSSGLLDRQDCSPWGQRSSVDSWDPGRNNRINAACRMSGWSGGRGVDWCRRSFWACQRANFWSWSRCPCMCVRTWLSITSIGWRRTIARWCWKKPQTIRLFLGFFYKWRRCRMVAYELVRVCDDDDSQLLQVLGKLVILLSYVSTKK